MELELSIVLAVALVFLAAGFVKGVVALGLPIFSVSLLSHLIGIREAIYITLAPALLTSLAQAVAGPAFKTSIRRLWPLLLAGGIAIGLATHFSMRGDRHLLALIVGTLIVIYAAAGLVNLRLPPPGRFERLWTPIAGAIGGALGGMSGMFAMPVVPYMQTLGLNRHELIQAIAIWFVAGAAIMLTVLGFNQAFTPYLIALSAIATATSMVGIWLGALARGRMSEKVFAKVFLSAFLLLGLFIVYRGISGGL